MSLPGYTQRRFSAQIDGGAPISHDVYSRGEGPPVIVIQELPGIGPQTLDLATTLVEAGHQCVLPHLFGPLGRVSLLGNTVRAFCMRRELTLFSKARSSPVTRWLAALCADIQQRGEGPGVGVIGMCLTGNFAISLMAEPAVVAAVAAQPSMPLADQQALHMSGEEVAAARAGLDRAGAMLAYRFAGDRLCQGAKFDALGEAFNDDAERIRLRTLPGRGHSVFTLDFVDSAGHPTRAALDETLAYFRERLQPPAATAPLEP